jgi:hypothetical protein
VNVALTGLPLSGKTCLFTALCEGAVDSASTPARADRPNAARGARPDPRLDWLQAHYQAPKRTPVQMEFLDLPGLAPGRSDLASQNTAIMEHLRRADLLVCAHTHRPAVEQGPPLVVNPGEAGGWLTGRCTAALVDLDRIQAEIIELGSQETVRT